MSEQGIVAIVLAVLNVVGVYLSHRNRRRLRRIESSLNGTVLRKPRLRWPRPNE